MLSILDHQKNACFACTRPSKSATLPATREFTSNCKSIDTFLNHRTMSRAGSSVQFRVQFGRDALRHYQLHGTKKSNVSEHSRRPAPQTNPIQTLEIAQGSKLAKRPTMLGCKIRNALLACLAFWALPCSNAFVIPAHHGAGRFWHIENKHGKTALLQRPSAAQIRRGMQGLMASSETSDDGTRILIVGGSGRIGTAVATHLAQSSNLKCAEIILAGRNLERGQSAVEEVIRDSRLSNEANDAKISFQQLDWKDADALNLAVSSTPFDAVINTAGPYLDVRPSVLKSAIAAKVPCYVDVADPLEYLDEALAMSDDACSSGTCALVAGGAFPGFSNLLALEAANLLDDKPKNVDFNYFTAGLGGSGAVNLYITNIGFGEPVETLNDGAVRKSLSAGEEFQEVPFFVDSSDPTYGLIGSVNTWAWPFPEGRTVGEALGISGRSRVAMGTAPEIWNVIMGALVKIVPRGWWRREAFSQGLALFSRPMVALTDLFVGETHAIRVDVGPPSPAPSSQAAAPAGGGGLVMGRGGGVGQVEGEAGGRAVGLQGHESFRRCVGQSCAEFALHLLAAHANGSPRHGVFLPEQRFEEEGERAALVERLSATPGTLLCRIERRSPAPQGQRV